MPTHLESASRRGGVLYLYAELWHLVRGSRQTFLAAVLLLIGAQLLLLAVPWFSAHAINTLQVRGWAGMGEAGLWLLAVLGVAAGSWMLHGPARVLERNVALRVRQRMSSELVGRLTELPLGWHEQHHSGALTQRVQQSTRAMEGFAESQFIYLNSVVRVIGPLAALFLIDPRIGATALVGAVVLTLSVVGYDRAMIRLAYVENEAERGYAATLVDALGNSTSLFALRQGRGLMRLLEQRLQAVFVPLKRSITLNEAKWCTVDLGSRALSCVLVALFAWLAARGAGAGRPLLLGSLYMVWEYAQQAGGVVSAIAGHFQSFARLTADYASADPIRQAQPSARPAAPPAPQPWRRLSLDALVFTHGAARGLRPTLEGVKVRLERGRRYALIGASGSGKSTLLRVLAGLYQPTEGRMDLDGRVAVRAAPELAGLLRSMATLIPQDAEVWEGTLADNLAMCESIAGPPDPAQFPEALRIACAEEFVAAAPAGLDTRIAERAANWSGGQRSRIALARGVLAARGSALVLLDEPTASLDPVTESRVLDQLFTHFPSACLVASIHRLNLLPRFDEVLVMRDGQLVAQGTPQALALSSPEFQQLALMQRH